jgi:hypothetical protein
MCVHCWLFWRLGLSFTLPGSFDGSGDGDAGVVVRGAGRLVGTLLVGCSLAG